MQQEEMHLTAVKAQQQAPYVWRYLLAATYGYGAVPFMLSRHFHAKKQTICTRKINRVTYTYLSLSVRVSPSPRGHVSHTPTHGVTTKQRGRIIGAAAGHAAARGAVTLVVGCFLTAEKTHHMTHSLQARL